MPLDPGISQCTITYGVPKDFLGGDVTTSLQLIPTHDITWAATGAPVLAFASNRSATADVPGQFSVPHVDQSGFKDSGGNAFTNWAYTAIIRYRSVETGETREVKKNFAPLVGQATIDLDTVVSGPISIPVTAPAAVVLSVDGATGIVSLSGKQNVATLDADIAGKVATPGSATQVALSATYAQVKSVNPAYGDGTTDATTHIQSVIDAANTAGVGVYVPGGTYKVTAPLENVRKLRLAEGSKITAGAAMAAVIRTQEATRWDSGYIVGKGVVDANTNAGIGIHVRNFLYFEINGLEVNGGNVAGLKLGSATASGRSAEAIVSNVRIINNGTVVAASRGILVENSGDHSFSQILVQNYEVGVTFPAAGNAVVHDIHVWCDPAKGATKISFEDYSNNTHYSGCHADTPTEFGFRLYGYQVTLVQCGTYNNHLAATSTDNIMVGVKYEAANSIGTVIGHYFLGGSGSKRLKADVEAADGNYGLIQHVGCSNQNVVTTRTLYNRAIGSITRDTVTSGKGFVMDAATPTSDYGLTLKTNALDRWKIVTDGGAETGSNAGTGLAIRRFNDAGALLSEPVFVSRSSGTWVWKTNQSINDGFDISVGSTTGTKIGTSAAQKLSFYGLTPVVQQVVAGARGSAAALASLNAKLANLGLISDTTVAPVSTKTSSYTIISNDRYVIANGGTLTMTLPDPTAASQGYPVTIKNVNASSCTVASLAGGLIDGSATQTLAQWAKASYITDGTQWLSV